MYKLFTTLFLFIGVTVIAQDKGAYNPFKLLILKANTAILDASLYSGRDSMVVKYKRLYYSNLKAAEDQLNCTDCPKDSVHLNEQREQITFLRSMEDEVKTFQIHHILSSYSEAVYSFNFNEYPPYSTMREMPYPKTDAAGLAYLADTSKADYIVFFSNVHSAVKHGGPVLQLTTSLYSRADKKIILTKEMEGGTDSLGGMWTCDDAVNCIFINAVRSSTDEVSAVLAKRQMKRKLK